LERGRADRGGRTPSRAARACRARRLRPPARSRRRSDDPLRADHPPPRPQPARPAQAPTGRCRPPPRPPSLPPPRRRGPAGPRRPAGAGRAPAAAAETGVAVVPFGGGTGVVGGAEPTAGPGHTGVVALDTTRLDRLIDLDETSHIATFEAGVDGPTLERALGD